MDLKEININTRNCVDSAQNRDYRRALVKSTLSLRVQYAMEFVITQGVSGLSSQTENLN